jgi:hypothetical protein
MALTELVHDDLEHFGTSGYVRLSDEEFGIALRALRAVLKRLDIAVEVPLSVPLVLPPTLWRYWQPFGWWSPAFRQPVWWLLGQGALPLGDLDSHSRKGQGCPPVTGPIADRSPGKATLQSNHNDNAVKCTMPEGATCLRTPWLPKRRRWIA